MRQNGVRYWATFESLDLSRQKKRKAWRGYSVLLARELTNPSAQMIWKWLDSEEVWLLE